MIRIRRTAIVAPIVNVAAVVQPLILMMGDQILRAGRPAPIFGTLEYVVVRAGGPLQASVTFDQFLVPPPNILPGYTVSGRGLFPVVRAIKHHRQVELFEVAETFGLHRSSLGPR